jgi:S1-C subfamily serine protease
LHLEAREVRAVSLGKPVPAAPRARAGSILSKVGFAAALAFASAAGAQERPAALAENAAASVVAIKTFINPDARTMQNLGRERQGSGVVIDASGLVLTIGYLMVEAYAAEVTTSDGRTLPANIIGYDHEFRPHPGNRAAESRRDGSRQVGGREGRRHHADRGLRRA